MDILLIIYVILIVGALQVARKKRFHKIALEPENTICMKGMLAVGVLLCHLAQRTESGKLFQGLEEVGFLFAAIFFFYSGYVLALRWKKNESQRIILWKLAKRALEYIFVFFVAFLIYKKIWSGYSWKNVISFWKSGQTLIADGWFMIVLVIFSVGFFMFFRKLKEHEITAVLVLAIYMMCWGLSFMSAGYPSGWYTTGIAFLTGIIFGIWKDTFLWSVRKYYAKILWIAFGVLVICVLGQSRLEAVGFAGFGKLLLCAVAAVCVSVFTLVISFKIIGRNLLWGLIGTISYEIYLVQGIWLVVFRNENYYVRDDMVYSLTVILLTFVSAVLLHFMKHGVRYGMEEGMRRLKK